MTPDVDVFIQKETKSDRKGLLSLAQDARLGVNVGVVYIYSLEGESVNYPNQSGQVIYIGEAARTSEPTGKRFAQHISTSDNKGGDSGTIYSLSRYYWLGKRIRLQVFIVEDRKAMERTLLSAHVKVFGSLPICQGTTGQNYLTTTLSALDVSQEQLALFRPHIAADAFVPLVREMMDEGYQRVTTQRIAGF